MRERKKEREKEDDFSSTRKSMTSLLVFLCPIMSVDIGEKEAGDGVGNPCRTYAKRKRPREVHPLSSLFRLHPEMHPLSIFLRAESDDIYITRR